MAASEHAPGGPGISERLKLISLLRDIHDRTFDTTLLNDPAWNILLEVASSRYSASTVSIAKASKASGLPFSTGLRWVERMVDAGLLSRWRDPSDARRDLLALTDSTAAKV